jgi:hypothetical protein
MDEPKEAFDSASGEEETQLRKEIRSEKRDVRQSVRGGRVTMASSQLPKLRENDVDAIAVSTASLLD